MGKARIKGSITSISPYEPGTSSHDVGVPIVKLSSNENPYGPSPRAVAAICAVAGRVNAYPDKEARALVITDIRFTGKAGSSPMGRKVKSLPRSR